LKILFPPLQQVTVEVTLTNPDIAISLSKLVTWLVCWCQRIC